MDPITIMAAASAGIELVERLVPLIRDFANKGDITAEQQVALMARIDSLRVRAAGEFQGDHWKPSTP